MKKLLSAILATGMALSMSVAVFAATPATTNNEASYVHVEIEPRWNCPSCGKARKHVSNEIYSRCSKCGAVKRFTGWRCVNKDWYDPDGDYTCECH